jgi:hypothetical protein
MKMYSDEWWQGVKDFNNSFPINIFKKDKEIIMNPDILPTLEEWRLVCRMVKQQCELADEEILDTARTMPVIDGATMEQAYVLFARAILKKAESK